MKRCEYRKTKKETFREQKNVKQRIFPRTFRTFQTFGKTMTKAIDVVQGDGGRTSPTFWSGGRTPLYKYTSSFVPPHFSDQGTCSYLSHVYGSVSNLIARQGVQRSATEFDDRPIFFQVVETSASLSRDAEVRRREPTDEDAGGARRWRPLPARAKSPAVRDDPLKPVPPVSNNSVFISLPTTSDSLMAFYTYSANKNTNKQINKQMDEYITSAKM